MKITVCNFGRFLKSDGTCTDCFSGSNAATCLNELENKALSCNPNYIFIPSLFPDQDVTDKTGKCVACNSANTPIAYCNMTTPYVSSSNACNTGY